MNCQLISLNIKLLYFNNINMLNQFALILLKNIAKHFFDKQFFSYYIIFYKEIKSKNLKGK